MRKWIKATDTEWYKDCPKCSKMMYYSNKGNLNKAIAANRRCMNCKNDFTPAYKEKISQALKGKKIGNRKYRDGCEIPRHFIRKCPNCKNDVKYSRHDLLLRAEKARSVCNSCSSILYKKSWTHVIKDEHRQKMAASKAGYATFEEYMEDLDSKKRYRREVAKITRGQDISRLENYDKLRGLCGVEGAYQLDHIVSVVEGYEKKISPNVIGGIENLQIIPWKDNLLKSNGSV